MTTVKESLNAIEQDTKDLLARQESRVRTLFAIPLHLPTPIISNISDSAFDGKPGTWMSFKNFRSLSLPRGMPGLEILTNLEQAGWVPLKATLAKYGNYRAGVHVGPLDELPKVCSRESLKEAWPIASVWMHVDIWGGDTYVFYQTPVGIVKVAVDLPNGVWVSCRREEFYGGWKYVGNASFQLPKHWSALEPIHCKAFRDTDQSISANIHFAPTSKSPVELYAELIKSHETALA